MFCATILEPIDHVRVEAKIVAGRDALREYDVVRIEEKRFQLAGVVDGLTVPGEVEENAVSLRDLFGAKPVEPSS